MCTETMKSSTKLEVEPAPLQRHNFYFSSWWLIIMCLQTSWQPFTNWSVVAERSLGLHEQSPCISRFRLPHETNERTIV